MKNVAIPSRLLVLGLVALVGCGSSVQPIDVDTGCPEMPLRGPEEFAGAPPERVIDDFEDGNDLMLAPTAGRNGSWISIATLGATTLGTSSSRCVARGLRSGHLTSAATQPYAANWNAGLVAPWGEAKPWDASAYSGISFWIAMGEGATRPYETPIGVTTTDTAAAGNVCTVCGDYYAIRRRIPLTRTWTRWYVPFTDLVQYGFGVPLVPLNKSRLVSLIIWPESQFDIWIDDIRFEP